MVKQTTAETKKKISGRKIQQIDIQVKEMNEFSNEKKNKTDLSSVVKRERE